MVRLFPWVTMSRTSPIETHVERKGVDVRTPTSDDTLISRVDYDNFRFLRRHNLQVNREEKKTQRKVLAFSSSLSLRVAFVNFQDGTSRHQKPPPSSSPPPRLPRICEWVRMAFFRLVIPHLKSTDYHCFAFFVLRHPRHKFHTRPIQVCG